MSDSSRLGRFVIAQNPVYEQVLGELRSGGKRTHWMWFVFPQLKGLGSSRNAEFYGIEGRAEAQAYLRHNVLGPRLQECVEILLTLETNDASKIFGYPDDLKLHSCLTLFASVAGPESVFHSALEKYFGGQLDEATLRLLDAESQGGGNV